MKRMSVLGRIMLGVAYLIYGYLHFGYKVLEQGMVPDGVGSKPMWVIIVGICWWAVALSFFTNIMTRLSGILASVLLIVIAVTAVLPNFNGIASFVNMASICAMIGGSLKVAADGSMGMCCPKKE